MLQNIKQLVQTNTLYELTEEQLKAAHYNVAVIFLTSIGCAEYLEKYGTVLKNQIKEQLAFFNTNFKVTDSTLDTLLREILNNKIPHPAVRQLKIQSLFPTKIGREADFSENNQKQDNKEQAIAQAVAQAHAAATEDTVDNEYTTRIRTAFPDVRANNPEPRFQDPRANLWKHNPIKYNIPAANQPAREKAKTLLDELFKAQVWNQIPVDFNEHEKNFLAHHLAEKALQQEIKDFETLLSLIGTLLEKDYSRHRKILQNAFDEEVMSQIAYNHSRDFSQVFDELAQLAPKKSVDTVTSSDNLPSYILPMITILKQTINDILNLPIWSATSLVGLSQEDKDRLVEDLVPQLIENPSLTLQDFINMVLNSKNIKSEDAELQSIIFQAVLQDAYGLQENLKYLPIDYYIKRLKNYAELVQESSLKN